MGERDQQTASHAPQGPFPEPAHERVNTQIAQRDAGMRVVNGLLDEDVDHLVASAAAHDGASASALVGSFSPDYRARVAAELQRRNAFDKLPLWLQYNLSPTNPFHQSSAVDDEGHIHCTTAVRIEGVTVDQAVAALTRQPWSWWSSCGIKNWNAAGPEWDFVPEHFFGTLPVVGGLAMKMDPFSLHVKMHAPQAEGPSRRLPAELSGAFAGQAEMYVEAVDGGVVVHDTWMGVMLKDKMMSHVPNAAAFWTGQHLKALIGGLGLGVGSSGLAGLRDHLQHPAK